MSKPPKDNRKWSIGGALIIAVLIFGGIGIYMLMNARTFQAFGGLTYHVPTTNKVVALTLDDGPTPGYTEEVLRVLEEEDVKATFMLMGEYLHIYPELGKKIVDAGHQVGNHSYTHQHMVFRPYSFYQQEIEQTDAEIRKTGYTGEIVFRPPYGKKLFGLPLYLADHNRKTIMWDVEPESAQSLAHNAEDMASFAASNASPGSIILYHVMYPGREASLQALKPTITKLKAQGYSFVTVNDLLAQQ